MSEDQVQSPHPQVLRWNISDDHYNDGMTLYADGSLHINVGGTVIAKSLRGWFKFEVEADEEITKWKSLAGEFVEAAAGLSHGEDWNNGTHAKLHGYRQKLLDVLAKAREAGL